jgi:hypothetical protein
MEKKEEMGRTRRRKGKQTVKKEDKCIDTI